MKFQQEQLQRDHDAIQRALANANGSSLAVEALEVIPSLKLTDRGLVDVERFEIVDLFT